MKRHGVVRTLLLAYGLTSISVVFAFDPPHDTTQDIDCTSCHITHHSPDGETTTAAGNVNLCLSCHLPGGLASALPFSDSDQARPEPGLPSHIVAGGTAHRWDSGPAGHVAFRGGAALRSSGTVQSRGDFIGRFAKTYEITVTESGGATTARFTWSATGPGGGSGSNLLAGADVPLDEGITIAFADGPASPSFQVEDRWLVYVRPDIRPPTNATLLARMVNGSMKCSTCHDQHSQEMTPFDPGAPAYAGPGTGAGRHLMRIDNNANQLCSDCHAARNVTDCLAGSHPVGVVIPSSGDFQTPGALPLEKTTGKVQCLTCHQTHHAVTSDGALLRLADRTALCTSCHTHADTSSPAVHFTKTNGVLWPGGDDPDVPSFPPKTNPNEEGTCGNCHQAHGWPDAANLEEDYPHLLIDHEEALCLTCHDGQPSTRNIKAEFAKDYAHPTLSFSDRHRSTEDGDPAAFGSTNRHAECVDCHNPHVLKEDGSTPTAPTASARLKGVGRVSVANVSTTNITYTYRDASDSTPAREYELCFKCHSSWTTQPSGQADLAAAFNTLQPSYHPVEAAGKNTNIDPNAFVNGWAGSDLMFCTDCHTSDDPSIRGPHGSAYPYLIKKSYVASSSRRTTVMSSDELCFDCHRYNTYANNSASSTQKGYSRFNSPTFSNGHTYHVGSRRYPCFACHDSHGSATKPHLIVTGRSPGLDSYTESSGGGTCNPTCHGSETYTINYAR